jgi:predicted translin family RNA/ssDNA-binding protein
MSDDLPIVIDEDNIDLLTDHEDIVQELRDFSYIIKESTGVAVVTMLEGTIFDEAADEIERLRREVESLNFALDDIADFVNDPQVDERIKDARNG